MVMPRMGGRDCFRALRGMNPDVRAVLSVNGLLVLVLGIVPGGLMALCAQAVVQMLGT